MVNMLACSGKEKELESIYMISKDVAALMTEDKWDISMFHTIDDVEEFMTEKIMLDAVCFDVALEGGISTLERLRKENRKAYVLLIASNSISPLRYIKPTIMASSLMLRPLSKEVIRRELELMVHSFNISDDEIFVFKDKDGKNRVPFSKILCFEARDKKIFACTASKEYAFYDSLEKLAERIPDYFIRCHRGFIVNSREIIKVALSDNAIYLTDDYMVPLSRSYKGVLKEFIG